MCVFWEGDGQSRAGGWVVGQGIKPDVQGSARRLQWALEHWSDAAADPPALLPVATCFPGQIVQAFEPLIQKYGVQAYFAGKAGAWQQRYVPLPPPALAATL